MITTKLAISFVLTLFLGSVTAWTQEISVAFIKVADVNRLLKEGAPLLFVEVRTRQEYLTRHIKGAASIPLAAIDERLREIPRERLVVLY